MAEAAEPSTVVANEVAAASSVSPSTAIPAKITSSDLLSTNLRILRNVGVPVNVTLAAKKQTVKQIVELAPGSLIQFNKPCDRLLDLCVGEHRIAQGLAVKVGDKFGLKIDHLTPTSLQQ